MRCDLLSGQAVRTFSEMCTWIFLGWIGKYEVWTPFQGKLSHHPTPCWDLGWPLGSAVCPLGTASAAQSLAQGHPPSQGGPHLGADGCKDKENSHWGSIWSNSHSRCQPDPLRASKVTAPASCSCPFLPPGPSTP